MWRAIGSSVIGTSHEKLQLPCQDACEYYGCTLGSERVLLVGIADGAGSASASQIGSAEAVRHVLQQVASSKLHLLEINEYVAAGWLTATRQHLEELATARGLAVRELACTFLLAILGETRSLFLQIGDGAWIARAAAGYTVVTWPSGGEYANQTTFLTSPNWREQMQFSAVPGALGAVAGFTDGLQNVALHFASRTAHAPFFDGKLQALGAAADVAALQEPLRRYLASPALAERTDDDKTLVLACRHELKLLGPPSIAGGAPDAF